MQKQVKKKTKKKLHKQVKKNRQKSTWQKVTKENILTKESQREKQDEQTQNNRIKRS